MSRLDKYSWSMAMVLMGMSFSMGKSALFRINCGGEAFVDKSENIWQNDQYYQSGSITSIDAALLDTSKFNSDIFGLYTSERMSDPAQGNLKYEFDVLPGEYTVTLRMLEIDPGITSVGMRVFDVEINNEAVSEGLDIFSEVGLNTPLIKSFPVSATNGKIGIEFINKTGNAKISGIEILPVNPFRATAAPYRINCGGDDFIDSVGNYWEGDGHFIGGFTNEIAVPIADNSSSFIYQSERYNGVTDYTSGDMSYVFDVTEGTYEVNLHFAEIFFQKAGQRVFSVDINGTSVAENLDVTSEAGARTALVKKFTAVSADGKITIGFRNDINFAKISGIEILPVAGTAVHHPGRDRQFDPISVSALGAGVLAIHAKPDVKHTFSILDLNGKQINTLSGKGTRIYTGLRAGVYIVKIQSGNQTRSFRIPLF
jgi:hypothetical protein